MEAAGLIEKIETPEVEEVAVSNFRSCYARCTPDVSFQDLDETVRGAGGFGSTGGHVSL